jgi:hypothetical protein
MVNGLAPTFEFHPSIVRTASSNSSQSIGRGSAGARCAGSVVIGSAVHVPLILARHKDKSPDFRPILADTFRETQAISRIAINRPISAAPVGTGSSSVFRHAVSRARFSYVLAESGLRLRERIKHPEIGGRIRTFSDSVVAHSFVWSFVGDRPCSIGWRRF